MESWDPDSKRFPKTALIGAALLIGISISFAAFARLSGVGVSKVQTTTPAVQRDLRFVDGKDGSVEVHAAADDTLVAVLPPGTSGFVRVVMRGLASDRKRLGGSDDQPFRLTRWDDGRLSISDPVTRKVVHLDGFGQPNRQAFAQLLSNDGVQK